MGEGGVVISGDRREGDLDVSSKSCPQDQQVLRSVDTDDPCCRD